MTQVSDGQGGYWIDIAGATKIHVFKDRSWRITNDAGGQIATSPLMRDREEIRVLRLIEYVGSPEWIANTLASQGALIPSGTGSWGGRITSAVVPSELLTQAAAQVPSTRESSPSFTTQDQLAEIARLRARVAELEDGLRQIGDAVATPPGMEDR